MLAFLPWMSATESLKFGRFQIAPAGAALTEGEIPESHREAVRVILQSYEKKRRVDQDSVALIRAEGLGYTDDLSDEQVTEYFEFRTRLAFAVLAARRFFEHRYANSDNVSLVIQGFTPESAGAARLQHRRRDGSTTIIVPAGNLSVPRPHHLDWCSLPRDLDINLLAAFEAAAAAAGPDWPPLSEAMRLFVGANTDGPAVGMHAELIDVVSAFSRMAPNYRQRPTVDTFIRTLPSPLRAPPKEGAKLGNESLRTRLKDGRSVREIWLDDAFVLRGEMAHGKVESPRYVVWTEREHLLLAAVVFPLYVKAHLKERGLYEWTEADEVMNTAFDHLALLEPFAPGDEEAKSWNRTVARAQVQRLADRYEREWPERAGGDEEEAEGAEAPES